MNLPDDFCVFILSHGRPHNQITLDRLSRHGYTGPWYIVIDNEDPTADEYFRRYGRSKVIMFDKKKMAAVTDEGDNFSERKGVVYARNACFDIARDLGYRYFLQLDDDYAEFVWRFDHKLRYKRNPLPIRYLDRVFATLLDFYKSIPATTISMSQTGDFIGGWASTTSKKIAIKRKVMNTFFCSVDRPFKFAGIINEDTNTYVVLGNRGHLMFMLNMVSINQQDTQSQPGGLTDIYLALGTYVKSFYTVMMAPSCTKIAYMTGTKSGRIHHRIDWETAVPKIISSRYVK